MISKSSVHSVLALAYLSKLKPGEHAGANQIAQEIGAPGNYLGKLLKRLAEAGLLESTKGYAGGFRLKRPAAEISVYDIVDPLENLERWKNCFLGEELCSCDAPCSIHNHWDRIRSEYLQFLKETTIDAVALKGLKI